MMHARSSKEFGAQAPGYHPVERVRRALSEEVWNIGVVDQSVDDIARRGITTAVRWLPDPPAGTMLADPAYRPRPGGGGTLYAERLDYANGGVGEIWSAEIAPAGDLAAARFGRMLAHPYHMSYPFPLGDASQGALMTAESWQANGALLWDGAREIGVILPGRKVVDPTLWFDGSLWWLFCTFQDIDPNGALYLHHAPAMTGPWTAHPRNPVQTGRGRSRPAGPLFLMGDTLVRPAQDCSTTYGGAVVLHAIDLLTVSDYHETTLRRLEPLSGRYASGLHTICAAGDQTLIDGKRWRVSIARLPAKLAGGGRRLAGLVRARRLRH